MKKAISLFLVLTAIITVFGCTPDDQTVSSDMTSESYPSETIVQTASSEESVEETQSKEDLTALLWKEIDGVKYYDIDIANKITPTNEDSSALFIEEAEGYYIEEDLYYVDADTMFRVLEKKFKGNGAIKWTGYSKSEKHNGVKNFDGVLHISRMDDPIYVSTCLPNERSSYMQTSVGRIHAAVHNAPDNEVSLLPIGAVYTNDEKQLPDDAKFTLCLGRMTCAVKLKGKKDWKLVVDNFAPDKPKSVYYLPWELQSELGVFHIDESNIKFVDTHYEISLTGKDLNGAGINDDRVVGSTFHFWGEYYRFEDSSQIEGVATSMEVWVKEPEYADYFTASVAADWRNAENRVHQVFCSINYAITDKPRVVFGHNVVPAVYDEVMNSEQLQELMRINNPKG